jgi:glycosyltransferase involved in cell wall biosynthesis
MLVKTMRQVRRALVNRTRAAQTMIRNERSLIGWRRGQRTPILITGELPVIICIWRRLDRLQRTLEQLAAQDFPVQVLIWNNSPDRAKVDAEVMKSVIPVTVHHSERNIGGFGRFYLAREVAEQGHDLAVFIDDDLDFEPGTIRELVNGHRRRSMSGWWAFNFHSADYRSKFQPEPGEIASLIATCGMIVDTAVFRDARLFRCPRRYWFAEDIWLSYVAGYLWGYTGFRNPAGFSFDESAEDNHAQYHVLGHTKVRFLRYLIRQGWDPVGTSAAHSKISRSKPATRSEPEAGFDVLDG